MASLQANLWSPFICTSCQFCICLFVFAGSLPAICNVKTRVSRIGCISWTFGYCAFSMLEIWCQKRIQDFDVCVRKMCHLFALERAPDEIQRDNGIANLLLATRDVKYIASCRENTQREKGHVTSKNRK